MTFFYIFRCYMKYAKSIIRIKTQNECLDIQGRVMFVCLASFNILYHLMLNTFITD